MVASPTIVMYASSPRLAALALVLVASSLAACLRSSSFTSCSADHDCTSGGRAGHCESGGVCSIDDPSCPSGRVYHTSAGGLAGQCVPAAADPDARPDTSVPSGVDAPAPALLGRECAVGAPIATGDSMCAGLVCATDVSCCATLWDAACVHRAQQLCPVTCPQMALVGGAPGALVIDPESQQILWSLTDDRADGGAWADFDGDGNDDLALSGQSLLRVFRNEGRDADGLRMREVYRLPRLFFGTKATWTDIDHDGDLDPVFFGYGGIVVVHDLGNHAFGDEQIVLAPSSAFAADIDAQVVSPDIIDGAFRDLDHDGYPELVVGAWFDRHARLYRNDAGTLVDTGWQGPQSVATVLWCNLDDDPARELILAANEIDIYKPNGLDLGSPQVVPVAGPTLAVRCADLDGDGDPDLIGGGWGAPTTAYVNKANGTSWPEGWHYTLPVVDPGTVGNGEVGLDVADLDGDHRLDAMASGHGYQGEQPLHLTFFHQPATHANPIELTATPYADPTPTPSRLVEFMELASMPPLQQ